MAYRRHLVGLAVAAAALALAAVALALPSFASAPKTSPAGAGDQAEAFSLAAACHRRFDRVVVRLRFGRPGYDVRYVRRVQEDASGRLVRLAGRRRMRVLLRNARAHTEAGVALLPRVLAPRCANLRQLKLAGDFEGVVTLGLGLRRRTGFRVFRLLGPERVVIDVAHR